MIKRILIIWIVLLLAACKSAIYVANTDMEYKRVASLEDKSDPEIDELIAPYRQQLSETMDKVIGQLTVELTKERPESNIGNWLADMMLEEGKNLYNEQLDFAVQNHGGVRVNSMASGPVTIGEIFEIMPFDNKVVVMEADSAGVLSFLHHIAKGGGWPISRGLQFSIEDDKAINVLLNGEPLKGGETYSFALPDYIANGGSGSSMIRDFERYEYDVLIRDMFIKHIQEDTDKGIDQFAEKEGRITNLDNE